MNFVGRVFNSMSDLYKDMNPTHISGANDVVVVQTPKGMHSTGFHARFGNVHSFKTSREVIFTVNDRIVNVDTRLDKEGNIFFSLHTGSKSEAEEVEHAIPAEFKTIKMLVESSANYSYLLSNYEKVYEAISARRYAFSESLHRPVKTENIASIFNAHRTKNFLGSDTAVVGLFYEENAQEPAFYLPFGLFSELYFCSEEVQPEDLEEKTKRNHATGKYLIKQLLRKRVQPKQMHVEERHVFLPDHHLKEMSLSPGPNKAVYRLSGTPIILTCTIYLWKDTDKVVISDIDGTITKSDVMGYIYGAIGRDWTHDGIAELYSKLEENGYKIAYLSSRPVGHTGVTRAYLERVLQEKYKLPQGPVILFPGRVLSAIYSEVILGPEEYKIAVISEIKQLLGRGDVFSGFGNKESDRISYEMCEIDPGRIFIVNPLGEITTGKNGLVKLSHRRLCEIAEGVFPPVRHAVTEVSQKYIGSSWWKTDAEDS